MIDMKEMERLGFPRQEAEAHFNHDLRLFTNCLYLYFLTDNITKLERAVSEKRWKDAENLAHTMKGSSGNLKLMPLYRTYLEMTDLFRAGQPEEAVKLLPEAVRLEREFRLAADWEAGRVDWVPPMSVP